MAPEDLSTAAEAAAEAPQLLPPGDHPDGPRTLWTMVRDAIPLAAETVDRGLNLERGRHPTMTDVRYALGLDFNADGAWNAVRSVRLPNDETPSDELLAHFIDEMYRGLASGRLVRVVLSDDGLEAAGSEETIRMRATERLRVLVFVDNITGSNAIFSVGDGRTETTLTVEAGRTASALVDVGGFDAGAHTVPITCTSDGHSAAHEMVIACEPSWTLTASITEDGSTDETPARLYLEDALGAVWPPGATIRRDEHDKAFFHAGGRFEVRASGDVRLLAVRGMEYEPTEMTIEAPANGNRSETVHLKRWSEMAAKGWRSADVHVHLHYGGEYLFQPEEASRAQRAEDVHFMNMMVANQGSAFVHDRNFFEGRANALSDADHILRWGEEYRNDFLGHLCMYGIEELVPPIYSGFRLSEHRHDIPANAVAADRCHDVGGTLSYAHPLFDSGSIDRVFTHSRTVEAKEMPVDVALGKIDALDVMSYPSVDLEVARLWYRLLNCGFRLPATAGTDTFMNLVGPGIFSNPPAGNRVFARIEAEFTTEAWCEAVRRGRTFVTNGPMLSLTVDGQDVGSELEREASDFVDVRASAESYAPMASLELIVNGDVATQVSTIGDGGSTASLDYTLAIDSSCWIALRATGPSHPLVLGGPVFAHTSPVYVTVDTKPVQRQDDAAYFVEWIDRLIEMCCEEGRYVSDAQRDEVIHVLREGQQRYQAIVDA